MDMLAKQYDGPKEIRSGTQRPESLSEQLHRRKENLENELGRIQAAIEALDAHPEVLNVLELLSKV